MKTNLDFLPLQAEPVATETQVFCHLGFLKAATLSQDLSLIGMFVLSSAPPLAETAIAARAPAAIAAAPETDAIAPNHQVRAGF